MYPPPPPSFSFPAPCFQRLPSKPPSASFSWAEAQPLFSNLDGERGNRMSCTLFGSNRFSPFHNHKTKDLFQNWKQSDTARLFENHGYKNKKTSKWILLLKKLIIFNIRGGDTVGNLLYLCKKSKEQ